MDNVTIKNLLTNSGLNVFDIDRNFVYFEDPSCIFPAFDSILHYAWIVALVLTGIMLFGWGMLYIRNGVKINTLFNNAKTIILIFATFSLVKPIVNMIYGDNLFAKQCEIKRVSLAAVNELLEQRNQKFGKSDEYLLYETFEVQDSGPVSYTDSYEPTQQISIETSSSSDFVSIQYESDSTIYVSADGTKIKRSGGSPAWRNNNPGNIIKSSFARTHGAIGEAGRWAVFPDEETGLKAIIFLLRSDKYNNLTLKAAIHKWAPTSDGNKPDKYSDHVSKMTNIRSDSVISNLSDNDLYKIARAIQTVEGWIPGTEESL